MSKRRKDSYFGLHLDLHPMREDVNLGADLTADNVRRFLRAARPDFVTYDCKGHPGWTGYPSEVGYPSPGIVRDSLAVWRQVTEELGIGLGVHYSGLQDFEANRRLPQFARRDAEGRTDGKTMSVFSDYDRDYMVPQLKEIIRRYRVDALWLDAECWGAEWDYGPGARAAWEREFPGRPLPKSAAEPGWESFAALQRRAFEDYLKGWTAAIHAEFPHVDCCSNWAYTTMMPKAPEAEVDMISGDFDPVLSCDRARTECRYLENVGRDWELQSWTFDTFPDQDECLKPPEQLMQEAGVVLMHGGGYINYYLPSRGGYIADVLVDTVAKIADFVLPRRELCHRSRPVREVGVFYNTADQLRKSEHIYTWWGKRLDCLEGVLHALLENHYSTTVLADHQLAGHLEELSLLVVPEFKVMAEETAAQIRAYIAGGGSVLVLGANAANAFADLLGFSPTDPAPCLSSIFANPRLPGESPAGAVGVRYDRVSAHGDWLDPVLADQEVLFWRFDGEGLIGRSSSLDYRAEGVCEGTAQRIVRRPAAVATPCGRGRAAAVLCDIGSLYFANHHPALREAVRLAAESVFAPRVRVDAPADVDCSLRETADGRSCLHLLNLANMPQNTTRRFVESIPPRLDIVVRVRCERAPRRVVWEPEGRELPFVCENGELAVTVPRLHIHGVLVWE